MKTLLIHSIVLWLTFFFGLLLVHHCSSAQQPLVTTDDTETKDDIHHPTDDSSVIDADVAADTTTSKNDNNSSPEETLQNLTNEELEAICTSRGFELVKELDEDGNWRRFTREDYIDAAQQCLEVEAEM